MLPFLASALHGELKDPEKVKGNSTMVLNSYV